MPRNFIRRYLPEPAKLRRHKSLRLFGQRLHDPNLWHLNRRSVSGGLGLGVFVAFIPVPGQMGIAAALSMWLRVNLPLAVATVWITNPVTMPPIFFFTYKVGIWLLSSWPLNLSPTGEWLQRSYVGAYGGPLLLGSLVTGIVLGVLTYSLMLLAWRLHVISRLRRRRASRRLDKRV